MAVLTTPSKHGPSDPARAPAPTRTELDCLCDEHRELALRLSLLDEVAEKVDHVSAAELLRDVYRVYDLVAHEIVPHMRAEEMLLMRLAERDRRHVHADRESTEMRDLIARLAGLKTSLSRGDVTHAPAEIRHVLFELHALTRLHFADELRICRDERHTATRRTRGS